MNPSEHNQYLSIGFATWPQVPELVRNNRIMQSSPQSEHADTIIRNHVMMSMGAGVIPIMLADIVAVTALQIDMVRQLCRVYEVPYEDTRGKAVVSAITTSTLARTGARSLIKAIPGIGWAVGGVAVSVFAGASTWALGKVFKQHLAAGGTILDFDTSGIKKAYQDLFEKGKEVVKEWKQQETEEAIVVESTETEAPGMDAQAAVDRLQKLQEWLERGVIDQTEFDRLKKALMEDLPA